MNCVFDKCILVIDDETGVTRLCDRFLSQVGYQVLTTNHPHEAVNLLDNKKFDLLLVDIRMPEMNGFELLNLARQSQSDIAVVIMTGYGTVETAVESLRQGADGMLLKPFSGAELGQSVEQALHNRQREREMLRLQALRPLFAISEKLFIEKAPELLRTRLLETVTEQFQCSHASIYQRKLNTENWEQLTVRGKPFNFRKRWPNQFRMHETSSFSLAEIDDPILEDILRSDGYGYFFCIPLNFENVQRVLFAARDIDGTALDEVEVETLRIFTRQAIVALENAHLYDNLQDHIRQLEESQRALVQAEKMAAVGRLTASIAHEINNPLHSVRNCLHLARRQELPVVDREAYLEMACEETDRLMRTVRQMLDFYRPSALDRKPSDINSLIERVLDLLKAQLTDNQIKVKRKYSKNLPQVLAVDNQIQQVFFNLILNAMEAMPTGGKIFITTFADEGNVSILIEDTGFGINDEQREDIFEPFVSSKDRGLGLGLTVSYGVVTAHGGSLTLMSPSNDGACFKLSLPAYKTNYAVK